MLAGTGFRRYWREPDVSSWWLGRDMVEKNEKEGEKINTQKNGRKEKREAKKIKSKILKQRGGADRMASRKQLLAKAFKE